MRDGHHYSQHDGQQRPHGQERVGDEGDQDELPHALLRGRRGLQPHRAQREGAAEEREGEAEEQRQVDDLLQLSHLQVLDISYDEEGHEDDTVHRVGPLGDGEAGAGQQLHHGQRRGHEDEHGQGFEGGGLLQLQVVVLEEGLELLAVELVLAHDGGQGDDRRTVTSLSPGFDFLKRYFLHVSAIHKLNTCSRAEGSNGTRRARSGGASWGGGWEGEEKEEERGRRGAQARLEEGGGESVPDSPRPAGGHQTRSRTIHRLERVVPRDQLSQEPSCCGCVCMRSARKRKKISLSLSLSLSLCLSVSLSL